MAFLKENISLDQKQNKRYYKTQMDIQEIEYERWAMKECTKRSDWG
jgi:hypothetical protein